jgi:hypothetical protein
LPFGAAVSADRPAKEEKMMKLSLKVLVLALSVALLAFGGADLSAQKGKAKGKADAPAPAPADADEPDDGEEVDADEAWNAIRSAHSRNLTRGDDAARMAAIEAYAGSNHRHAVRPLFTVLNDTRRNPLTRQQRWALLEKLGEFTDAQAIQAIIGQISRWTEAERLWELFLIFKGFAAADVDPPNDFIIGLVTDDATAPWVRTAALEAMAEAAKHKYVEPIFKFLQGENPAWDNEEAIVPVTAVNALGLCFKHTDKTDERLPVLRRLRDMLDVEKNGFRNDRVRYFVASAFAQVARLPQPTEDIWWMDWYLLEMERGNVGSDGRPPVSDKTPAGTNARWDFVGMPAFGRRVVFALDLSLSMEEEIDPAIRRVAQERAKERKPQRTGGGSEKESESEEDDIDWANIRTRLDLAKAYLYRSLDQLLKAEDQRVKDLEEWRKSRPRGGPRASGTRSRSILEEPYKFNIVIYETKAVLLDEKSNRFLPVNTREIQRMKRLVEDYDAVGLTNIHGALVRSMQITEDKFIEGDPAFDSIGLTKGADTIMFLTDGWASWSDDSDDFIFDPRVKNPPPTTKAIGNGAYIMAEDIMADFMRLNRFRKIITNCIGIGNHDRNLMQGLAKASRGEYVDLSGRRR